jgi:hypothetical protein
MLRWCMLPPWLRRGIKAATTNYVNRKRLMSTGTLPLPPSKRHAMSSSAGPYGKMGASASKGNSDRPRCSKYEKPHTGECRMGTSACF